MGKVRQLSHRKSRCTERKKQGGSKTRAGMKRVSPGKVKDGEMIWGGGSPGIAWDSDSFFKVGWESVRTVPFPHRQNMRAKSSHESKGHIRFSGQGMEVESEYSPAGMLLARPHILLLR